MGIVVCLSCGSVNDQYNKDCSGCGRRFREDPGEPPSNYEEIKQKEFDMIYDAAKTMYAKWKNDHQMLGTSEEIFKSQDDLYHANLGQSVKNSSQKEK